MQIPTSTSPKHDGDRSHLLACMVHVFGSVACPANLCMQHAWCGRACNFFIFFEAVKAKYLHRPARVFPFVTASHDNALWPCMELLLYPS